MWFINKLENAWYELIAPEKEELSYKLENLKQSWDIYILENSIWKLNKKIEESANWKQRYFLEKQLEELEKIKDIYNESRNINITDNTKKEIKLLINWLEKQINIESNNIWDDTEKLYNIMDNEKTRLDDNLDLLGVKNIRDRVKKSINIIWTLESVQPKKYQNFFDILTIEYINFIEKKLNKKLEQKEEKYIIKNDWLFLDIDELDIFVRIFFNKNSLYDFDLEIKLEKNWKNEKIKLSWKKYIETIRKEKLKTIEKEEKLKIKKMKEIFEKNIENFTVKERMTYIKNILNEKWFNIYYNEVLNYLENTNVYLKNKKIKINNDFINKNKEKLIHNIKMLTSLIIEIESDWNHKAKNPESTATWLWQWLIDDWKKSKEYMYNQKWYSNKIKWKEPSKIRNIRLTSSFETDLKSIKKNFWNSEILEELSFIKNLDFKSRIEITPDNLFLKEQIKILILRLIINNRESKNWAWHKVNKKNYLATAVIWNRWWIKKLYKKFHHTNVDIETDRRIKEIIKKYNFEKID